MDENNLTEFVPQELAADQPNTFLQEQGITFSQHTIPADISEAHVRRMCHYLV